MKILIVDGWTKEGNRDHERAGCGTQASVFEALVTEIVPGADIETIDTQADAGPPDLDLGQFDAAIWTGGGGNIYQADPFNRRQLALCERVLAGVPFVWGSCWGLQVIATVCGGKVAPAGKPEVGIAYDITTRSHDLAQVLYGGKPVPFDAPTHHFDEIERLPDGFEILAENAVTLQAAASRDGRIFCTQYHPEIPYDYVRRLLIFWRSNYLPLLGEEAFQTLLDRLPEKEIVEGDLRKMEFRNWLAFVREGALARQ